MKISSYITPEIEIITRDINGKKMLYSFKGQDDLLENINAISDEDEVLIVNLDKSTLYSALSSESGITIDDITGFFA